MAKVKILFLASNPLEQSRLTLDEEIRAITAQLRSAEHRDALELVSGWAVRPDDLQQLLLEHKPQIVHFSGHGNKIAASDPIPRSTVTNRQHDTASSFGQVGRLELAGEDGQVHPMSKEALLNLFGLLRDSIRVVLLNACHSESIAETLAEVIPCTIGMRGEITDEAAIAFSTAFYRCVGFGRNAHEAFCLGKNVLMNLQPPQDHVPQLFAQKGAVAAAKVAPVDLSIGTSRPAKVPVDRNRAAMLQKVRTIWIDGILRKSLFQEVRILLGLSERPDAVQRPFDLLVRRLDGGEHPLPPGTRILDVYDRSDASLLILGEPGSGKTTELLVLARDLLERAEKDPDHPIPVVFLLSSWAETRKPLIEWLLDELNLRYDVPRRIAEEWVATDQVLPLLDGLDEVKAQVRDACAQAINLFRRSHGLLPLVITSRSAEYEAVGEPLHLHGAIRIRPLSRAQVNAYFADLGPGARLVADAFDEDPSLYELLDSPLWLSVVTLVHADSSEWRRPKSGTVGERRDRLVGSYVHHMLGRGTAQRPYELERAVSWLSWLAAEMDNHGHTAFYLEGLQVDWLPQGDRWTMRAAYVVICGLAGGLVCSLSAGVLVGVLVTVVGGLAGHLATGLIFGLVGGFVGGLIGRKIDRTLSGELVGLTVGLTLGPVVGLIGGVAIGLAFGVIGGLAYGFRSDYTIYCVEIIRWSWPRSRGALSVNRVELFVAVLFATAVGIAYWNLGGPMFGVLAAVVVAMVFGLLGGVVGLLHGLIPGGIETKAVPNQGVRRSALNGLKVGVVFGLLGALCSGLVVGLIGGIVVGLTCALVVGLVCGLLGALRAGWRACSKHLVLRLCLIRNDSIPWNYVKFLDYCADRILLRKAGRDYMFIHRMLLEWFAARYVGRGTKAD
jgi:hypothetical protein